MRSYKKLAIFLVRVAAAFLAAIVLYGVFSLLVMPLFFLQAPVVRMIPVFIPPLVLAAALWRFDEVIAEKIARGLDD